jgi:hypothetical protein
MTMTLMERLRVVMRKPYGVDVPDEIIDKPGRTLTPEEEAQLETSMVSILRVMGLPPEDLENLADLMNEWRDNEGPVVWAMALGECANIPEAALPIALQSAFLRGLQVGAIAVHEQNNEALLGKEGKN